MERLNTVRVNLTNLGTGKVELNGKDVSSAVAGLTINANVGDPTSVLLRLPLVTVSVDAEARIELPERVEALLVAAGWTPPETHKHRASCHDSIGEIVCGKVERS